MKRMDTDPKKRSPVRARRGAKASGTAVEPAAKPFLRFYHSEGLRKRTLAVLDALEQAEDPGTHSEELADILVELMNAGTNAFFIPPLRHAKVGFLILQSASLGLGATQQVLAGAIRNIVRMMDSTQLLSLCGSVRRFMR
jgi:hypothetical protein